MGKDATEKVIALVPAHNEANCIERTIFSLINQTHSYVDVLVISDNSTDNTVDLVKKIMETHNNVNLIETVNNTHKKAGALNQGYKYLSERLNEYRFVLSIDGDTIMADNVIEQGITEFYLNDKLGSVCSRSGVMDQKTNSFLEKYIYHVQHLEYGDFDRDRIGQNKRVRVAHGMCSLFKVKSIQDVIKRREINGEGYCVYRVTNIIEDFELTVTLRELGYQVTCGFGMYAWTEVPLTIKSLWRQRIRWYRGGIDTIREHGVSKVTILDTFDHVVFWLVFLSQLLLLKWSIEGVYIDNSINLSVFIFMLLYANGVYTLRYVQNPTKWDYAIRLTYIPHAIYTTYTALELLYSYFASFFNLKQEW
ncbi:MAG: glycosyltransferase family 2 protein [Methanosarcina sp.]|nr:hypothetical protein BGV40_17550 [Methanosarcina sp. Ant1]